MSPPSPLTPPPRMTPNLHAAGCSPLCTSSFVLHREPPCAVVPWSQSGRTRNAGGGSNVASPSPDPATCQLYVATLAFMAHLLHLLLSAGLDPTAATRSLTKIPISSPQLAKHALETPAFSIAVPPGGFKDDSYLDSPPTVAVDFLPKICLRDELGGWSMSISDLKKQLDGARSTYGRKRGKESRKCGENAFCQSFGLPLP